MDAERLRRLFRTRDSLTRQLVGLDNAIKLGCREYSQRKGFVTPMRVEAVRTEVFNEEN